MQARITGTTMPVLEFLLEPNETIISEAGELSWMGAAIQMTTHTQFGGGGGMMLGIGISLVINGAPIGWLLLLPGAPASAIPGWLLARRLARQV